MNTRHMIRRVLITAALASASVAHGADLADIYQRALQNDPLIREAEANRLATREAKPQALSQLLPQLQARGGYDDDTTDGSFSFVTRDAAGNLIVTPATSGTDGATQAWQVELRQSIFRWENWASLKRADVQVAQAEADYQAAQQELIVRASERYFEVLAAKDTLDAAQASQEAIARQLEQAEKRFEVGLIAITDVQEAKAAFDQANATLIQAKRLLATQQERLRELTGDAFDVLDKPAEDMPLKSPDPASEDKWVETALAQNLRLISSRLAADVARQNVSIERGGHLPRLDVVVAKGNNDVDSTRTLQGLDQPSDSDTDSESISLQLVVPLYSGGYTSSRVRETQYRLRAARERLEATARETERSTRDAYMGVVSELARVQALKQALESARTALAATEAGYEVGTRTTVDVLDARRRLFDAQTNYARSRYDYLLNVLRLRNAAGTLDPKSIAEINSLLTEQVAVR